MNENLVSMRVWGDFACFTRPEMKVERVSYPLITPSAARGIFEAVFWEPQILYLIDSVHVIEKGSWTSFRRNELTATVSLQSPRYLHAGGGADDGTQRTMLALQDVEYIITAEVRLSEVGKNVPGGLAKYLAEMRRRAAAGKCYHRPCFGVREFAVDFEPVEEPHEAFVRRIGELGQDWRKIWPDEDLGLMLYDVFCPDLRKKGFRWLTDTELEHRELERVESVKELPKARQKAMLKEPIPRHEGQLVQPQPMFFRAKIHDAVMRCHPDLIDLVKLPGKGG